MKTEKHIDVYDKTSSCCKICWATVATHPLLHMRNHHGHVSSLAVVHCEDCGGWFPGHQQLQEHMANHREGGEQGVLHCTKAGCSWKISTKARAQGAKPRLGLGVKTKTGYELVQAHMDACHQVYGCAQHQMVFEDIRNYKRHMKKHSLEMVKCDICGKMLKGAKELRHHISRMHEEKTFTCDECPERKFAKIELGMHRWNKHGEKNSPCSQCEKSFITAYRLKEHFSRVHLNDRQYSCSYTGCNKSFFIQIQLNNHERIHTGEKPFECKECASRFRKQDQLSRHKKIHTGEKPHICQHCGKGFIQKSNMTVHQQQQHSQEIQ